MTDTWSPATYLQFGEERTRAARDLLAQVPLATARRIVDVGCGPGNSTRLLLERYPGADVLGIDSSAAMLSQARQAVPDARFEDADAASWLPAPDIDLVFANAVYQWVPDHTAVLRRVLAALPPHGVLAVQMPDTTGEPTHQLMERVARDPRWASRLSGAPRDPLPEVRAYYDELQPASTHLNIWQTIYHHVLDSAGAIVEWVRGTGLRPFLTPLTEEERVEFLGAYTQAIAEAYPPARDGRVLLRFPRLFIVAVKKSESQPVTQPSDL
jgi:trans-aconitate 2-methyltransferase